MRSNWTLRCVAVALLGLSVGAEANAEPAISTTGMEPARVDWRDAVLQQLDISDFEIVTIDVPPAEYRDDGFLIEFETEEGLFSFVMHKHSVRSARFEVLDDVGDGELRAVVPPPVSTYRGEDGSGAIMAASIHDDRLEAWIALSDESLMGVQQLSSIIEGADPREYVVYLGEDGVPGDWRCGVPDDAKHTDHGLGGSGVLTCAHEITDVAFDADFEYYQLNGSSISNVVADIEGIMNALNVIYERDVLIQENVRTVIVRSTSNDPYTSSDPGTLLNQFANHWNFNHGNILRDHAHLMTGRNLNGGVIGIAFLGVICNVQNAGYGLSQSRFTNNFTFRVALTAHEIGHNWNAQHCNGQSSCRIMCSGLGGCSGIVTSFGSFAISQISAFRNSRPCIYSPCATLVDVTLAHGTLISGAIQDLRVSDDAWYVSRSRFGFTSSEPNLTNVRVGAISGATSANALAIDLRFEGRLNQNGGTTRLQLRNWTTNQFQTVATFPIGSAEVVQAVNDLPATDRVRTDRRIEVGVRQFVLVTFSANGFRSSIDHVQVLVKE